MLHVMIGFIIYDLSMFYYRTSNKQTYKQTRKDRGLYDIVNL